MADYTYAFAGVYVDFPIMKELHKVIKKEHVVRYEKNPHVTLLYGLHTDVLPGQVEDIVSKYSFGKLKLYGFDLFDNNEEFDVTP